MININEEESTVFSLLRWDFWLSFFNRFK